MSKLRSVIVWLVLYTQVWTPVLAQTLPISVDKSAGGQRPVVGVSNGVPVVNIAPPSAGGVSNNRFTQFNVGPSGVVLNNSGAASRTQLAGQIAGNAMLGNQRAATILNQVTAPNPSQLMGMLEVAGNRANVIVANPAGITCNGCGFLNADRATLTTGKPVIGPNGLSFEIAGGGLSIEGAGLNGANLSQVDLMARTLEINAKVWADRLNLVAGGARVGYDGVSVDALAAQGGAPAVALDVAALGGMYANSIRLVGTEAGVGVNVGGNVAALTGSLSVSANGDVKILPSGRMQAATDLSVQSGRGLANQGVVTAGGAIALNAAGRIENTGEISGGSGVSIAGGQLGNGGTIVSRGGALQIGAAGDVRNLSPGRLQAAAGLSVRSAGQIVNEGAATAGGGLALSADGSVINTGGLSASGNVDLAARQLDNSGVLTAGLQADGSVSPLGAFSAQVQSLRNSGTLVAGGDASVTADALNLSGGRFAAGGALAVEARGAVRNADGQLYGASVDLKAGSLDNAAGKLTSGGALTALIDGAVDNAGGTLAAAGGLDLRAQSLSNARGGVVSGDSVALRASGGIDNQGGAVQAAGALSIEGGALDNRDGKLLGGSVDIKAASLDNRKGVAHADGRLAVDSAGAVNNQDGGLYGGSADDKVSIKAASLENQAGKLVSGGALDVNTAGHADNTGGTVAAQGAAGIQAQSLANTGGLIAAAGLTLRTLGTLDNAAGLIQADGALDLAAAALVNRDTLADGASGPLGVMGGDVTLNAGSIDNQAGRIGAGQTLGVATGVLNNARGNVSSDASASLAFSSLVNDAGAIAAGTSLDLVAGALDNTGKIHSAQDLTITAGSLTNRAGGEIVAARDNTLNVSGALSNAGLIDGGHTRIDAGSVTNTSRIYGDRISIQTPALLNDADAVIASRGDMDLGVGTLTNREHALIYAGADLRVGGALDAAGRAAGQAALLSNESATIEVAGNADIAAAALHNRNMHFASETVEVSRGPKLYYRLENSTEFLDGSKLWLCDAVTELCGRDPVTFLDDDSERRLLLPSTTYPESRYGPPFDYVKGEKGKAGVAAPIPPAWLPDRQVCDGPGGDAGGSCVTEVGGPRYKVGDRIWSVFGVAEPGPVPPMVAVKCNVNETCLVSTPERDQALAANKARHDELGSKIYAFNADFNNRLVTNFFYYKVEEVVMESRTVSTDPAKIIVGGAARFTGAVTNDKSRIIAGGTLSVDGPAINNIGAQGIRSIERVGSEVRTVAKGGGRKESWSDYRDVAAPQRIDLAVASSDGNTAPPATGNQKPGASAVAGALAPARVMEVGLPGRGIIRVVTLPPTIPTSSLYRIMPGLNERYLVATDSRFLGQLQPVSSDFLLQKLNEDSGHFLKRLGDGFYEQKLVAEQIMLATGQRFVGDYTDNESQYKALLSAGADFAGKFGLTVGTALSEEQMRHLTSDIVWLVEQTVTLPDGTQQKVLAPQVYLAVKPGDLRGDGTLIAGRDTQIKTAGDVKNSGTIGARNALVVEAQNIRNTVGSMQGQTVNLAARNDIDNIAGLLKGDAVALSAGRDINLTATTQSNASGGVSSTRIDGVARIDAGTLNAQAGRDFNAQAAAIAASGDARIQAGNNINLTTAEERYAESYNYGKKNRAEMHSSTEVGSSIAAGGNLTLVAGRDVNARAAEVTSDKQLAVGAGRDINVAAGTDSHYAYNETYYKQRGFLSSKSEHRKTESDWTSSASSTFTGDSVVMMAGRDLNVAGSNVAAQNDLVMSADRNVNIVAVQNKSDEYQYEKVKKSGFGALGGISYGSRQTTDWTDTQRGLNTGSTVGSVQGDVLINAGRSLNVLGSDILARQGDITMIGRDVSIVGGADTMRQREFHEVKQTGLTLTASNPVVSAMQTAGRMADAAGKTDNPVMQGLAGATTGLAAYNAYDAVQASAKAAAAAEAAKPGSSNEIDKAGGVSIKLSLGSSKSSSTTDRNSTTAVGSTVAAGKDLTIIAKGAGSDSDITVTGSSLSAGRNAVLKAEGDILLQAARNAFEQKTESKSSSASIGIGYSTGGSQNGFTLELGASMGRGKEDGRDESWTNSNIVAGKTLALQSGGDTTLKGASGKAEQIIASVGGNLLLESLQDTSKYDSKNKSAGFGVSLCIPPYCAGSSSVSANAGTGKMHSDFKSVTEQTGLWAGDGGFMIDVKNNTTLIGSVIASSDKAVAEGLNKLATGTLVTEDIKNKANYNASQVSVGGGIGFGGEKGGGTGLGTTKDNQVAGGASKEAATSVPTSGNVSVNLPTAAAASGSGSSTTHSAISGGTVVIRDEVAQQNLTGMTAAETIAALNRDTSDTLNALKPIFDKEKIEAGFEIVSEANRQTGQFLANRAKEADELKKAMDAETDPELKKGLKAQYDEAAKWGPDGEYRLGLTVIVGAVGGNVTGSTGQFVQAAAVNYLQALGVSQVKSIADELDNEVARTALQGLVGCAGAAGKGGKCEAGAMGAAASVVLNNLVDRLTGADAKKLSAEGKEAHANLVASIVAGLTEALGGDAAMATVAAQIETGNNYFGQKSEGFKAAEQRQFDAAIASCGPANPDSCARARELAGISEKRDLALANACADPASSLCGAAIKLATASGNIVFFDTQGKPIAVPADSPMIQATPDPRDGTFHYTISASVAEGLAIDSGGGALSGISFSLSNLAITSVKEINASIKGVGSVVDDFFAGTKYTDKVVSQIKSGDLHAFPESVKMFQEAGEVSRITGGDGVVRDMLKIPGEYRGKQGVFEFIKEADGSINHRLFKPNPGQ
ncbi:hemagglutinin repeat-containing protein [Achromobacter veterisilvae]|uniref:Hemagglutinin repeat-containing protein n=1 Tax=Achromobacter veterisilvae TaxID=2069367 RepID=A0ABZ2S0V0_9BURK